MDQNQTDQAEEQDYSEEQVEQFNADVGRNRTNEETLNKDQTEMEDMDDE